MGAAKKSNIKTVDIDGLTVNIDEDVCKSWNAYRLMLQFCKDGGEITPDALPSIIAFVELVSDVDEAAIVEHCGGNSAPFESVMGVMARIISEAAPKNS